jgi:D-alanyl-lipoteichoic acid acyltransferase DltB (MBOAT superfamily)
MLFNSIEFMIFLPLVFLLYWSLGRKAQNQLLLVASYFFYGWWDWRFLSLIVLSSGVDFAVGNRLGLATRPAERRGWLILSLAVNLGILGFFKYFGFFVDSAVTLLEGVGLQANRPSLEIILPIGISFYTFQTLSYTIDVYRERVTPHRDWIEFFAYVSFFPQLVAGPIERAHQLLGQFAQDRHFDPVRAAAGCRQMLWGLFKKIVIADRLSLLVDAAYGSPEATGTELVMASVYFGFQIYCDFSGYSDIAIGCARLLGFDLMRNFAYPFFSRDIGEFWRRWHISLSTWFRDYLYIPLGGGRASQLRVARNVMITFLMSGLWHGANWTYVIWGGIHGALQVVSQRFRQSAGPGEKPGGEGLFASPIALAQIALTFAMVTLLWTLFRAESLAHTGDILVRIATDTDPIALITTGKLGPKILVTVLVVLEWLQRGRMHPLELDGLPKPVRYAGYYATILAIVLLGRFDNAPFVYFQF